MSYYKSDRNVENPLAYKGYDEDPFEYDEYDEEEEELEEELDEVEERLDREFRELMDKHYFNKLLGGKK